MPELPEVESVRRSLLPHIVGKRIADVKVWREGVLLSDPARLTSRTITGAERRGKYLMILLDDNSRLAVHLRMTGQLVFSAACPEPATHTHVQLLLEPAGCLTWTDTRRFGRLQQFAAGEPMAGTAFAGLDRLGPEPLGDGITPAYLQAVCRRHARAPIKSVLLNQDAIAGLGNIYADETLFQAGIDPRRPAGSLAADDFSRLAEAIRDVIGRAVERRGTTLRDYVDADRRTGEFRACLCVYGRKGLACTRCGAEIQGTRLSGRATCFCPSCQKG